MLSIAKLKEYASSTNV